MGNPWHAGDDVARRAVTVLGFVVATMLFLLALLWLGQRQMIYFPDPDPPPVPAGVREAKLTTEDGLDLTAWWITGPAAPRASVVVFPGNAGNRGDRLPLARALLAEGLDVLLVDYRGYGGNPGSPTASGILADARAAGDWVDEHVSGPVIYLGESLGCAPATHIAGIHPPAGIVLRSPFPSLVAVARHHYPVLPAGLLLRDNLPVAEWAATLAVPVRVVAGSADTIIPPPLSREVAEIAGAELIIIGGADHNDPELAWGDVLVDTVVELAG